MRSMGSAAIAVSVLALSLTGPALKANDDDKAPQSVTVSFGAGLNTAVGMNPANHQILPQLIKVREGGVVNFAVSGFHWIWVYNPDTTPDDIDLNAAAGTPLLINDTNNLFYQGINPGGPAGAEPSFFPLSNARNRVEAVSFPAAGTYLVICNIRPHFLDGMFAFVTVVADNQEKGEEPR